MAFKQCSRLQAWCTSFYGHPLTSTATSVTAGPQSFIFNGISQSNCHRQFSKVSASAFPTNKLYDRNKQQLFKPSLRLCNHRFTSVRHKSSNVVYKFTKDIDLAKLREELKRESRETGENIQLIHRIQELVTERCAQTIAEYNEEEQRRLKVLKLEHNFLYSEGHDIPDPESMKAEFWVEAMAMSSKSQRLRYYSFQQRKEYQKRARTEKREAHKLEMLNREQEEKYPHGVLFMRIYERTMTKWLEYRLASSMQYGIPLVFDMDYDQMLRPQELKNTAQQLHSCYTINRADTGDLPFHLHFTCCQPDNAMLRLLQIKTQDSPNLLATVTEKSYLDLFDKERLIYLSPNGKRPMKEFDPNAVYIVGAINDKALQKPVSYARAMEQGIKCLRLPLDEHLQWNQGTKSLTLDQMMKILRDRKNKLPWKEALKSIPTRKLVTNTEITDREI